MATSMRVLLLLCAIFVHNSYCNNQIASCRCMKEATYCNVPCWSIAKNGNSDITFNIGTKAKCEPGVMLQVGLAKIESW